jgi:hypothetical protein
VHGNSSRFTPLSVCVFDAGLAQCSLFFRLKAHILFIVCVCVCLSCSVLAMDRDGGSSLKSLVVSVQSMSERTLGDSVIHRIQRSSDSVIHRDTTFE